MILRKPSHLHLSSVDHSCSTLVLPDFKAQSFTTPLEDVSKLDHPLPLLQRPRDDKWQIFLTQAPLSHILGASESEAF